MLIITLARDIRLIYIYIYIYIYLFLSLSLSLSLISLISRLDEIRRIFLVYYPILLSQTLAIY
jgi:hypothetical protein